MHNAVIREMMIVSSSILSTPGPGSSAKKQRPEAHEGRTSQNAEFLRNASCSRKFPSRPDLEFQEAAVSSASAEKKSTFGRRARRIAKRSAVACFRRLLKPKNSPYGALVFDPAARNSPQKDSVRAPRAISRRSRNFISEDASFRRQRRHRALPRPTSRK